MSSSPQCSRGIAQPAARWANARHKENTPPQLATPQLEELLLAAQGTPRSARTSGLALSPKHPQFTEMFSEQMDQRTVEVPAEKWMDCFLSSNRPTEEELAGLPKYTSLKSTGKKRSKLQESTIYPTLCHNINKVCEAAGSRLVCKDVANWPENGLHDRKPDLAFYVKPEVENPAPWTLSERSASGASSSRQPHVARCAWAHMQIVVEVKRQEANSGFYFSQTGLNKGFLRDTDEGRKARAQHALYPTEVMLRQHRRHALSICITGGFLRGFFWDRNGLVASKAINMKQDPHLANTFFWRLVTLDDEGLGHDPTVQLAGPEDLQRLSLYDPQGPGSKHLKSHFHYMWVDDQVTYPIYKVRCAVAQDDDSGTADSTLPTKSFLIGQYVSGQYSPTGRATRGYVAYDLEDNTLVFLKDQWRANAEGCHPELETYKRLKQANVSHVATAIAGGDVLDPRTGSPQRTVSQIYLEKYSRTPDLPVPVERIHTRLVLREVGRPLEKYRHSIELIRVCRHALCGLKEAWEKAGILHRDVSVANIMIDVRSPSDNSIGFLNDWDLCKYSEDLNDPHSSPSQPLGISGTWPFTPAMTLLYPRKRSEVADDQESIIYVLAYCATRFHQHDVSPKRIKKTDNEMAQVQANTVNAGLATLVHCFFYDDSIAPVGGYYLAGECKRRHIQLAQPPIQLHDQKSPLARLLKKCYKLLQKHYLRTDYDALEPFRLDPQPNTDEEEEEPVTEDTPAAEEKSAAEEQPADDDAEYVKEEFDSDDEADLLSRSEGEPEDDSDSDSDEEDDGVQQPRKPRPLDTHEKLWELFRKAFKERKGKKGTQVQPVNIKKYKGDWFLDQFNGLQPVVKKSSQRRSWDKPPTGAKRSPSDAQLDSSGETTQPDRLSHPHCAKAPSDSEEFAHRSKRQKTTPSSPPRRVTRSMAAATVRAKTRSPRKAAAATMRTTRAAARKAKA